MMKQKFWECVCWVVGHRMEAKFVLYPGAFGHLVGYKEFRCLRCGFQV